MPAVPGSALTVAQMCALLEVSKSGYYEWRSRPQSTAVKRRELLKMKIKALFDANDEEYGYRRMHAGPGPRRRAVLPRAGPAAHARAGPGALPAEALAALADRAGRQGRADPGPREPRLHRGKYPA